jgi:hypothetical protein
MIKVPIVYDASNRLVVNKKCCGDPGVMCLKCYNEVQNYSPNYQGSTSRVLPKVDPDDVAMAAPSMDTIFESNRQRQEQQAEPVIVSESSFLVNDFEQQQPTRNQTGVVDPDDVFTMPSIDYRLER